MVIKNGYTFGEVFGHLKGEPAVMSVERSARYLGLARTRAYRLAADGEYPVPARRVGGRYQVLTVDLWRYLGGAEL
ncbi:hypothetical protein [Saccharopolyspora mangrovi]|uniref:DNA-binding protein n=1 Tax=Saccharopolyspora mangrovi TaxID=3082379 RepID=A0ABU6AKE7_9PSEU|nr:hypothetical protein [Saccharopolyspora sp. S2-29]MEB3371923.1 hypothetical protein [Saccharopolyspora sp. S2-29]